MPMARTTTAWTDARRAPDAGIAMLEIVVSITLLAVGLLSLVATLVQNSRLQRVTREKHQAIVAAESILEDLRRADYDTLVTDFGSGGTPGDGFDVSGLNPRSADTDGRVGRVRFVLDETATDPVASRFGLPRDLNGDGDATDSNVATSHRMVPVRIEVEWEGVTGPAFLEFHAILTRPEESE